MDIDTILRSWYIHLMVNHGSKFMWFIMRKLLRLVMFVLRNITLNLCVVNIFMNYLWFLLRYMCDACDAYCDICVMPMMFVWVGYHTRSNKYNRDGMVTLPRATFVKESLSQVFFYLGTRQRGSFCPLQNYILWSVTFLPSVCVKILGNLKTIAECFTLTLGKT